MIIQITSLLNTLHCQKNAKVGQQAGLFFYIKSSSVYDNATL